MSSKAPRPARRVIPRAIKRAVVLRQGFICFGKDCSAPVHWMPKTRTQFDHNPALRLRDVRPDGRDYAPHQHEPEYIDALCYDCHAAKTRGTGATTAGTDVGKIKKERKRDRVAKPKRVWASRPMPKRSNPWRKPHGAKGR